MIDLHKNNQGVARTPLSNALQLRREAEKARKLADAAFGEAESRALRRVSDTLEREAAAIDAALADRRMTSFSRQEK